MASASTTVRVGDPRSRPVGRSSLLALLLTAALVAAACSPSASLTPTPTPTASATPSLEPVTPSPSSSSGSDPDAGRTLITVSPNLRVRSQPWVGDDSEKFAPLLPIGTEMTIVGGPTPGSGYQWYQVALVDFVLEGGRTTGWVAAAAKDGTPWVAPRSGDTGGLVASSAARAPADPAAAKTAAASINAFGLDLYRALSTTGSIARTDGAVISPASIVLALAMTEPGARGATATELATALHTPGWDALGPGLNALTQELAAQNATWTGEDGAPQKLALRIADAAFAQRGYEIQPSYLDQLASSLGAGLRLVDYMADPEGARGTINRWVADRTEQRIRELLQQGTITTDTRLVLVNAIYLKAAWALLGQGSTRLGPFTAAETRDAPFTRPDGSTVSVPTMQATGGQDLPYAKGSGWEATELLYEGAKGSRPLAMTLVKPTDLTAFEGALSPARLGAIVTALDGQRDALNVITGEHQNGEDCGGGTFPYSLSLRFPRFGLDTKAKLSTALRALGLDLALDAQAADFSGITGRRDLYIAEVIHQANIDVDEKGTEAAAATAVIMDTGGGCEPPSPARVVTLKLDRPFLFFLRDVRTGAILFMGRVVDPTVRD